MDQNIITDKFYYLLYYLFLEEKVNFSLSYAM